MAFYDILGSFNYYIEAWHISTLRVTLMIATCFALPQSWLLFAYRDAYRIAFMLIEGAGPEIKKTRLCKHSVSFYLGPW